MSLKHVPSRNRPFVPRLEMLEERDCPSVSAGIFYNTLYLIGDSAANKVAITDDGQGKVSATIDGVQASGSDIRGIVVLAGAGNDSVTYTLSGLLKTSRGLLIDLGGGDDSATLDASLGVASGSLLGTVRGGSGNDTIKADLGPIAANAHVLLTLDGGLGNDTIAATFKGQLNGSLGLAILGGWGQDTLSADITIEAESTGQLATLVSGGPDNDALTLNVNDGTAQAGKTGLSYFFAALDGGLGTDTAIHTDNVSVYNV